MTKLWMVSVLALGAAACTSPTEREGEAASTVVAPAEAPAPGGGAVAVLKTATGADVGRAVASEAGGGIRVAIDGVNMPPGIHGAHVHTTGRCDGPDFTTAGGHWNPTSRQHGTQNPAGPHGGDMPNLEVGSDGRGTLAMTLPSGTMAGMLDADGAAFVIHAGPDDLKTDPAGNSGGRIACGVFAAS